MRFRKGDLAGRFRAFSRFTGLTFQRHQQHQSDYKACKFDRCYLQRGHRRYKKEIEHFSKELWQIHSLLLNRTSGGD